LLLQASFALAEESVAKQREIDIAKNLKNIEEYYSKLSNIVNTLESNVTSTLTTHEKNFFEAYKTYSSEIFLKIKILQDKLNRNEFKYMRTGRI
jgi:hypothetical protein